MTIPSQAYEYHDRACRLIPGAHREFFKNCRDRYEIGEWIFERDRLDPNLGLAEQSSHTLQWGRFHPTQKPHVSGRKIICGHTPQGDGRPADIGHTVCIDTYL